MRKWIDLFNEGVADDGFLYHATFVRNLPFIERHGLQPNGGGEPTFDGFATEGKLFVSTFGGACWYAETIEGMYDEPTEVIRFPRTVVGELNTDDHGNPNDQWVAEQVAARHIEVRTTRDWVNIVTGDWEESLTSTVLESDRRSRYRQRDHESSDEVFDACHELEEYAQSIGVDLHLIPGATSIGLVGIHRETGEPGSGAIVMDRLCALADKHGLEITLDAEGGNEALFDYYGRWGFKLEDHVIEDMEDEDFAGPWLMYRLAKI